MAFTRTLILFLAVAHFLSTEAREFHVLDDKLASWQIPSSSDAFDNWAQKNRFLIGDSIVMKYDGKVDSVLEVSEADYKTCTKTSPIKSHTDGNTRIALDRPGPFFFISGADGHCERGQKLQMRVLAADHHHHHSTPAPAPAPFPSNSSLHHGGHHHPPAPAPVPHNGGSALRSGTLVAAAAAIIAAALV